MKKEDVRSELQAIAAGKRSEHPENAINPDLLKRHDRVFKAWERFAYPRRNSGEALAAPAEILTPLP